ncbi:ABC transporter permease [Allorhizobium borbori]|uniref:NitT/TauT family transport system permease protein n=1 Tax=Allorhizobium borbori TaxID=485907 RepID=A0A7W6K3B1_9HYPH|nr:ABC transporter permease subunit [Allorhizobium borbori]MBB4104418.1 NitT/TauT family transport system permease protein [Allorhizobium borbori]
MIERHRKDRPSPVVFTLSLVALVACWAALAAFKADAMVLPGPLEVWRVAVTETLSGRLPHELAATLLRVVVAFALAMVAGSVLGIVLGRWHALDRWFDPWVTVFLNLPALVLIVLCYLWIGLNEVAAITAVTLNKTAMVLVTIRQGVRAFDPALDDLTTVSRLSRRTRLRHIVLPQLAPWLAISARNGISVIWKIVLVVEFLGRSNGVGFRIHLYFQQFQTAHVLVYSLAFVGVMLLVEHMIIQPWERHSNRWRRDAV